MINLYLTRTGHHNKIGGWAAMDRLIEISKWVEKQFGKPDYHKNYSLDFGDNTEDWACFKFYDDTMGFWTQQRFQDDFLTEEQFEDYRS